MCIIGAIFTALLAIGGMINHSDWRYWMSAWYVCALFMIASYVGYLCDLAKKELKVLCDLINKELKERKNDE